MPQRRDASVPPSDGLARTGYVASPPHPGACIAWPAAFGTRFTLFVDTEEEFDWTLPFDRAARGTTAMAALPEAHARFAGQGVAVTYLIDHPVATSRPAVAILRRLLEDGRSTIGTQLHPWVNPPFDEIVGPANSYAGNLPRAVEAAKLRLLTDAIAQAFGFRPLVYRAGRYGIGPATFAILAELGYRIDSSMRVAYDYSRDGGPDYTAIGNAAFRTGPDAALIELPLTSVFTGRARRGGARLYRALGSFPRGRGIAARLGLLSRVALTPEDMPLAEALEAIRVAVGEGVRVLNFSFHSPSLAPGHTPYVRDAADLAAFHHWWDRVLAQLAQLGVTSASVDDLLAAADAAAESDACGARTSSAIAGRAGGL